MKKRFYSLFLTIILVLFSFGFTESKGQSNRKELADSLAENYFYVSQEFTPEWIDASLERGVRLVTANGEGYLYRLTNNDEQYGYFTVASISDDIDSFEVIISTNQGEDPLVKNPDAFYYSLPFDFYEEKEYYQMDIISVATKIKKDVRTYQIYNEINENEILSVNTSLLPPVPSSYYYTNYVQYYSVQKVLSTPEYYNEVLFGGCAPTSGAMLVAFYDFSVPDWDDLVSGTPPLHHDDNPDEVVNLVTEMGEYMNWSSAGTAINDMNDGLDDYFDDNNHGNFQATWSYSSLDYQNVISGGNPAIMAIYTDNSLTPNHAVLGIGTSNVYMMGTRFIVRYNWRSRPGEYSLNPSFFYGVSYMSRG